ncbi:secretion protein HlyD family protein [Thermocrinis albus DSM 14484]|uniref:Secretion protein HlyD family protein n=1 Tax=Thermocrinis albus (strain DSM 14484 / JCM 11386 / HI 11/12) TaxID=638303 RepID=D3SNK1_THEAH|nr:HlyD family efflux transporter periplasmic adaptor subunit [Thermocrinis albus]ADC88738.1 secretion protein HlyD family protein [Thermocrinis albus DSM 14484]
MKKHVAITVVSLLIVAFVLYGILWIKHRREYAISDAVFVKADRMANVGFQVDGKVTRVYVNLGDHVRKGDILAELDPSDYQLKVDTLEAQIKALESQRRQLEIQYKRLTEQLSLQLKASRITEEEVMAKERALLHQMEELDAQLKKVSKDRERYEDLTRKGLFPLQRYEEIDTQYKVLLEKRRALEKNLEELRLSYQKSQSITHLHRADLMRLEELRQQIQSLENQIEALKKQKELAQNQLQYTYLRAPFDGVIAKRFVSPGDVIRAGQPVFSVVDPSSLYVEVLLEETKLMGVKPGAKAYVRLDAYPDKVLEGVVEQISPASAATFALVPRDVSAGEFTKVVQRIPVKIRINSKDIHLLRVGMGGEVEIKRSP